MLGETKQRHMFRFAFCLLLATATFVTGCGTFGQQPSGELSIQSRRDASKLSQAGFDKATYNFDGPNNITVVAYSGEADTPTRAVVIRMFWQPKAGRTPIDSDATNATMHYVVFEGETTSSVEIYSGAGFVFPKQTPGEPKLNLGVWQADLRLSDSEMARDHAFGQAQLEGWITAARDDAGTEQMIRKLNHRIRELTGTVRMVHSESALQPQG